jgi:hypothetical protein
MKPAQDLANDIMISLLNCTEIDHVEMIMDAIKELPREKCNKLRDKIKEYYELYTIDEAREAINSDH